MKTPGDIPQFYLGVRNAETLNREGWEQNFQSPQFRNFANLLTDAMIVVDPDELVVFLNLAAERAARLSKPFESQKLATFQRFSDFDMDEFLAAAQRGQTQGFVRSKVSGTVYQANRRMLSIAGSATGFTVYFLRDPENIERSKRGVQGRAISASDRKETARLLFPERLKLQIEQATRAYARGFRILLLGESGVGKTAIARHIHLTAGDKGRPFIHVNSGSIPETLFESEMFGYERGAFTGALQAGKRGFIESAGGGTLFLDEIGEIPLSSQPKLLNFLEDGTIQPVGSSVAKKIETRVIAATNRDLSDMVRNGSFRKDLLYRLSTFPVEIPPLRNRTDKAEILDMMLERASAERGAPLKLSPACRSILLRHSFPGNLREVKSVVDYLDIVADDVAAPEHLPPSFGHGPSAAAEDVQSALELSGSGLTLKEMTRAFEEKVINEALDRLGSKRAAARELGVDIATIVRKTNRAND
ncbi:MULTISPECIES: sigma 54-interacting transcriptional regulator [Alphaproteobacteria]|uniref:HTH-type transcriptional regulatory protein TyrR n=2 Tax=Alphaproteobacteria TaxID=28211 RepID=A0A512HGZ1_9HYPH|nr:MULTISPECIES: sigma 54-interacting transcriptional regulator [Alphaproteobacteria]GEO84714.1 RNA polymerase subunit sigma-54 [Ciceribacter naphthalenivorans]GLR20665.1 RNA polymerase subunit sigma-54 [Ciceribacter naphthalenivorans]GLT03521.1 RNA polymerase subunit sigma-54 [Sphingomonas psychrolutea]